MLKQAIMQNRFDIAINMWGKFEPIITFFHAKLTETVIAAIEDSAEFWEYKLFFLKKFLHFMNNN